MTRDLFPVVVHVLLLRAGAAGREAYLLRRAGTGFMDGYYVLPGGHLQAGESLQEAAARECREETGVIPAVLRPLCVLAYRSGRHQGINMVFEGDELSGDPGIGEPERCSTAGWFPLARLPEPMVPWLGDVLELQRRGEWFRELYRGRSR
jgi:ADP-ribose pyrophosphatase YjhB (NUDIX family)